MEPWILIFSSIFMTAFSVYTLGIGLWGLIRRKKPLAIASRQLMRLTLALLASMVISTVDSLLKNGTYLSTSNKAVSIFLIGIFIFVAFVQWQRLRSGSVIFGIPTEVFQEALIHALNKLDLPYQENNSKIKLTSLDADLQLAMVSVGAVQIRVKQKRYAHYAEDIAKAMVDYYKVKPARVDRSCFIVHFLFGILMVAAAGFITVNVFSKYLFGF